MIKAAIFAAVLLSTAWGQTPPPIVLGQFLGENDTDPSLSIGNEAQSALNVESSLNGTALIKRQGYARTASLPISTSPATGVYSFIDANGNRDQIVCSDHNCAKSANNAAFTVFLSTAGGACVPTRWTFAQIAGFIYGANDCHDPIFKYDGTTRTSLPNTAPLGSILEATKDRLVVSGVSSNPNGVYYSQSGTYTNFVTGLNSADPYVDPIGASGDQVRALKWALGRLFIFKTNSVTSCILGDQYTSRCFPVSNTVGTGDPLSVVEIPASTFQSGAQTGGAILFKGSDNNYWSLDQTGLAVISRKISNLVASQGSSASANQSNTQTSQADWQAGIQSPLGSWDTTTRSGSIFPSSYTATDNTTASFSAGQTFTSIDTATVSNQIQLTSTTISDTWANGTTAGDLAWAITAGSFANLTNSIYGTGANAADLTDSINTASSTFSDGSWQFNHSWTYSCSSPDACLTSPGDCSGGTNCFDFRFMKTAGGNYYSVGIDATGLSSVNHTVFIRKNVSSTITTLATKTISYANTTVHSWRIDRSVAGVISLIVDGIFISSTTDTAVTTSARTEIAATGYSASATNIRNIFSTFYFYRYNSPGTFISRIFDTSFSTPTWGPFSSTFSVTTNNNQTQVDFYTRVSTSPNNDMWDSKIASSDTIKLTNAQKRYVQYEADLYTFVSTQTPSVAAVSLPAATTGQFITQCIQPGPGISAWGQLSCAQTLLGGGSNVFYATSAVNCASLPTGAPNTWQTSVTNNANLSISTNAAVYIGWRSILNSSADQAQIDACTLYWTNGVQTPPTWGTYDPIKNASYWTAAINNSATANRVLKYDLNLNEWYPFGLNATAIYRDPNANALYFGDSAAGYWNKYGGVTSDNGAAINAYWISRDFGNETNPFVDNNYSRLSLVAKNQVTGSMTVGYTFSTGQTGSYNVSLSTSSAIVYVHSNQNLLKASPYQFMNINLGNNTTNGFEIDALSLEYSSFGWRPQNP